MAKTQRELADWLNEQLNAASANITYITDADDKMFARWNGGRKNSDERNPFKGTGRVYILNEVIGYNIGNKYSSRVEGAAERSGATETQIDSVDDLLEQTSEKTWHKPYNKFFNTDKRTESKYYLKVQVSKAQKALDFCQWNTTWYIDGVAYSEAQAKEILKGWLNPTKFEEQKISSTQIAAGVDDEHQQYFFPLPLTKIVSIEQGDFAWAPEPEESEVMELAFATA